MKQTFFLDIKPYLFRVTSDVPMVVNNAQKIYAERFSFDCGEHSYVDFSIELNFTRAIRRFYKPQVEFFSEGREPFKPLPASHAFALLEWGMNWTVALHEFQRVIIHSAVLARGERAILLPAPPGSGKSTTTAYLENNGWRLLSDEMALIKKQSLTVTPFVRPICLKNHSIKLCVDKFPSAVFSEVALATHKGDVAHMAPQKHSVVSDAEDASIVGIIFPQYNPDVCLDIYPLTKAAAMLKFTENAFNFNLLGKDSFATNIQLIEATTQYELHFSDLDEVNAFLIDEFGE